MADPKTTWEKFEDHVQVTRPQPDPMFPSGEAAIFLCGMLDEVLEANAELKRRLEALEMAGKR